MMLYVKIATVVLCFSGMASALDDCTVTAVYTGTVQWTNPSAGPAHCVLELYGPGGTLLSMGYAPYSGSAYEIIHAFVGEPPDDMYIRAILMAQDLENRYRYEYDIDYPEDYTGYTHSHTFDFNSIGIGLDGYSLAGTTFGCIKATFSQ